MIIADQTIVVLLLKGVYSNGVFYFAKLIKVHGFQGISLRLTETL
jgi:hypothetical protein